MKYLRMIAVSVGVLFICGLFGPRVLADQYNQETKVTFNAPVEIPGRVLLPGTYDFRLMNSDSDRDTVQIFNEDSTQLIATVFTAPAYRTESTDKTVITFERMYAGAPEAIREWFWPGDLVGHEFLYLNEQPQASAGQTGSATSATGGK
jgi:hypothetical protein